jgi:putative phosphoesterase
MRIAIISDIHSNIQALAAILEHIDSQKPDLIVCTGDLVGYGANPNEVIDLLRRRNIVTIMGNYDDGVGNRKIQCGCDFDSEEAAQAGAASLSWTVLNTREENRKWLANLPSLLEMTIGQTKVLFSHGSPRKINEYMLENKEALHREILLDYPADVIISGHTHLPFHKEYDGRHIINAGSIGKPKNGRVEAMYTMLTVEKGRVNTNFISIPYDYEAAAAAIEAQDGLPNKFASIIREGK